MQSGLFDSASGYEPLASRVRPQTLDGYAGQDHLLGSGKPLRKVIETGHLHSMIFWGPPGVGKTTLARILAHYADAEFLSVSAVMNGVKEIRETIEQAQQYRANGKKTILFVDEVHRFNKSQQDAFLPYVENGLFIFIGATTENPSFELNRALLSRARTYKLRALNTEGLSKMVNQAMAIDPEIIKSGLSIADEAIELLCSVADGDGRKVLNLLEMSADLAQADGLNKIDVNVVKEVAQESVRQFDKGGDLFYEQISALHKAVRGSSVDGALYWFVRMIDGGCDPLYIARRVVRMASEEVGNADPRGLEVAMNAWMTYERLGSPEGELAIAQAIGYLASAPKSNAIYMTYKSLLQKVAGEPSYEVPIHLRNAPTALMKDEGYGEEYRYAHDEPGAYAAGECYLPEPLKDEVYYQPTDRGLEAKIKQKLEYLKSLDANSPIRRYRN